MDGRKLRKKRRTKLKDAKKRLSYQEFVDKIYAVQRERQEMEELFKRILVLDPKAVMEEWEIKQRNNAILEERRKMREAQKKNEIEDKAVIVAKSESKN